MDFAPFACIVLGIIFLIRLLINIPRYEKGVGVCTGHGSDIYEEYKYEYKGVSYTENGWRPGFYQKEGKEYPIWINKSNPRKIITRNDWWFSCIMILMGCVAIWIQLDYYYN
ncbi:MAG: hypothetical protein IJB96_08850 [Lachnospira sp.]|nr:hypothetical protein [Lachnospira sp.]